MECIIATEEELQAYTAIFGMTDQPLRHSTTAIPIAASHLGRTEYLCKALIATTKDILMVSIFPPRKAS